MSWQRKKLGEILTQRKEQISIQQDIEYLLVTISNKGKVRLREKKKGDLISAKKGYIAKSGDFIYSRLSVHTGAFGIVPSELDQALITGEMPCFAIDKKQVHPNILIDLIGLPDFLWQLKQLAKGMGRVRIKENMMMDLSVAFPSVTEQKKLAENLKIKKRLRNGMEQEITHQQILLKKLRQQILQEAIEGKLTAEWRQQNPDVEPASELLARIQAEKEQLIKDKKIKKQKPLPPISDAEKPFELPEGWEWVRFQDITTLITCGMASTPTYYPNGRVFLSAKNIKPYRFMPEEHKFVNEKTYLKIVKNAKPQLNDILLTRVGAGIGEAAIIDKEIDFAFYVSLTLIKFQHNLVDSRFVLNFLNSVVGIKGAISFTTGKGSSQGNLNVNSVRPFLIAFPSLPEQKAIAAKVEKLLALCDKMETQITANQTHSKQLMQTVLKEAFSQTSEKSDQTATHI